MPVHVFRTMTMGEDGRPNCGDASSRLGVRLSEVTLTEDGFVIADGKGMSVAPHSPRNLHPHFLPKRLGGLLTKAHVFELTLASLPVDLVYRQTSSKHGQIEPGLQMPHVKYQALLCSTKPDWREV